MLHVATVHWRDDRWVDIQLRYLHRFLPQPFRVYAFLNRLPRDHSAKFFYSSTDAVKDHATKLNLLGDLIGFAGEPNDYLLFIDGDAFPIAPVEQVMGGRLERHKLIAVRRAEQGDPQPHPCFCVTTVGFWHEIGGDWRHGDRWVNAAGRRVSDVGGALLGNLAREGVEWEALLRTNKRNPHPLLFAVYGDLVYHHGSGFRPGRGGRLQSAERGYYDARRSRLARTLRRLPPIRPVRALRRRFDPGRQIARELRRETAQLSGEMFARIERDDEFWRELV
jgi:hypothetical protein